MKLSPDGAVFYVADMRQNGLWEIDADTFAVLGVLPRARARTASIRAVTRVPPLREQP